MMQDSITDHKMKTLLFEYWLKKIHLADFPPNAAGATVGIYKASVPALKKELELIMIDPIHNAVIKKAQERFFPILKETAAKKVLGSILSLIN